MQPSNPVCTEEVQQICLRDLQAANRLILKWHSRLPGMVFANFYKMLRVDPDGILEQIRPDQADEFACDRQTVLSLSAPRAELGGKSIHEVIMDMYQPLAWKFAKAAHKKNPLVDVEDYHQEAVLKIWDAMHRWIPEKGGKLITLFWSAVGNRLQNVSNQQGTRLSHLTNNDIKLVRSYNTVASKGQNLTFEQTCSKIGLNNRQRSSLSKALGAVVAVSNACSKLEGAKSTQDASPEWEQQEHIEAILSKSG